jgi:hypothetical protein
MYIYIYIYIYIERERERERERDLLLFSTDHYGAAEARRDGGHDERAEDHAQRRLPSTECASVLIFLASLVVQAREGGGSCAASPGLPSIIAESLSVRACGQSDAS